MELRKRYDANGVQGLDVNFMDACEFFTMLFGSDKFQHLIGELMLATAARNGGEFSFAQHKNLQVDSHPSPLFAIEKYSGIIPAKF